MSYFACLSPEMSIHLFFFTYLCFGYFCSFDASVVCIVSSGCNQSPTWFLCRFLVVVSMYRRNLECRQVLFLLIFLTHTVCQRHIRDVRPYESSCIFLFSGRFVKFLPSSTLRMILNILRGGQSKYLIICWDF